MPTLKELLGEDFTEELTVSDIGELLSKRQLVDPETLPKSVKKDVFDKTASELATWKKKARDLEQSHLSDEEKQKQSMAETEDIKKQYQREMNKLKAKEIFVNAGIVSSEIEDLLTVTVSEDLDKTLDTANKMLSLIQSQSSLTEEKVKKDLFKTTPKPNVGEPLDQKPMTKEEFKKLTYSEKADMFTKEPKVYEQLTKKEN